MCWLTSQVRHWQAGKGAVCWVGWAQGRLVLVEVTRRELGAMATSSTTAMEASCPPLLKTELLIVIEAGWWCVVLLTALTTVLAWMGRFTQVSALGTWGMVRAWGVVLGGTFLVAALRVLAVYVPLPSRLVTTALIVPLLLGLALLGAGVPLGHAAGWLIILAVLETAWWYGWPYRRLHFRRTARPANPSRPSRQPPACSSTPPATEFPEPVQQMVRYRQDGCDVVWGKWRLDYVAGTERLVVHVPVYPPLEQLPHVDVEAECQGQAASCRVTQREVYGVRVEAKLAAPAAKDGQGWLEFVLRAPTQSTGRVG